MFVFIHNIHILQCFVPASFFNFVLSYLVGLFQTKNPKINGNIIVSILPEDLYLSFLFIPIVSFSITVTQSSRFDQWRWMSSSMPKYFLKEELKKKHISQNIKVLTIRKKHYMVLLYIVYTDI